MDKLWTKQQVRCALLIYLVCWGHVASSRMSLQVRKARGQGRQVAIHDSKNASMLQLSVDPVATPAIATACFIYGVKTGLIVIPTITVTHAAAGIGAGGIIMFIAVVLGAGATISYGGYKLYDLLTQTPGFTNETLAKAITHSTHIAALLLDTEKTALIDDMKQVGEVNASEVDLSKYVKDFQQGELSSFVFVHPGSDVAFPATRDIDRLKLISDSCEATLKPMGLGDSESSSRSGAMFWKCATPTSWRIGPHHRTLIKGGIRDGSFSPEWETFKKMAPTIGERFDDHVFPTTLNRVHFGFDAFGVHWLALEDLNVGAKVRALGEIKGLTLDIDWDTFDDELSRFYDVKPLPSRAPQLSDLLIHIKRIREEAGDQQVEKFAGWRELRAALEFDLYWLSNFDAIDESMAVQVVGPLNITLESEPSVDFRQEIHSFLTNGTPRCAYHLKASDESSGAGPGFKASIWLVCVSVFDYFLTLSAAKSIQNQLQSQRWDDYGGKMTRLFDCIGDDSAPECEQYTRIASGQWVKVFSEEFEKNDAFRLATRRLENDYRCCCDFQKYHFFGPNTPCRWDRYGDTAGRFTGCSGLLWHVDPAKGGCSDVDPPAPPPEPECAEGKACCCDMTGVEDNMEGVKVSGFRKNKLNTIFYMPEERSAKTRGEGESDVWQGSELNTNASMTKHSLLELRDDACMDWLLVSYSDLTSTGKIQSGTFHLAAGEWRSKELFRKTDGKGCVKVYTAKCAEGGIEVREFCSAEKESISMRCLGGMFCVTSTRKSDIRDGEVIVLNDPSKRGEKIKLQSGRVSFQRVDAEVGSRKMLAEGLKWNSMDGKMVVYHCGDKWFIQETKKLEDTSVCDGLAFTNHVDWTSPEAVWWEWVKLWGWSEAYPSIRSDLTAADVLAPMGKCSCSSSDKCETYGLKEMEGDLNRAAYCPKQH